MKSHGVSFRPLFVFESGKQFEEMVQTKFWMYMLLTNLIHIKKNNGIFDNDEKVHEWFNIIVIEVMN